MSRSVVTELKSPCTKKKKHTQTRLQAGVDDRLTGPRQTSPIDQNHSGLSLLIKQHGDLRSGRAGDRGGTVRGESRGRKRHKLRDETQRYGG